MGKTFYLSIRPFIEELSKDAQDLFNSEFVGIVYEHGHMNIGFQYGQDNEVAQKLIRHGYESELREIQGAFEKRAYLEQRIKEEEQ